MWKFLLEAATVILAFGIVIFIITLQFQEALACGFAVVVLGLLSVPADRPNQPSRKIQTAGVRKTEPQSHSVIKIYLPAALLEPNSKPLSIVAGASQEYGVPPEVLLSRWYQESGMQLKGDRGGAGGYHALAQIVRKQTQISERHRWHRFRANERDLRAIAEHCGYDLQTLQGSSTGAQGPMQFQPSTWVLGAVDADGDGKACPLNLADAMYTAARKLANDYRQTGSWNGAILAYAGGNCARNRAYVRRAQPLLRFFHNFWEKRNPVVASK